MEVSNDVNYVVYNYIAQYYIDVAIVSSGPLCWVDTKHTIDHPNTMEATTEGWSFQESTQKLHKVIRQKRTKCRDERFSRTIVINPYMYHMYIWQFGCEWS